MEEAYMNILKYILGAAFALMFIGQAQAVAPENLAASAKLAVGPSPALIFASRDITNGTVKMGINPDAGLDNTLTRTGLVYIPTGADALIPGCPCEGWGVADKITGVTGYVNKSSGTRNATVTAFSGTASTAKSVVMVKTVAGKPAMQVTHVFRPSISRNLFEARVTIKNVSAASQHILYRRVMDWDVPPTTFREYVTIKTFGARRIVYTSDNGFASSNPLVPAGKRLFVGQATDSGPADHGADFDFDFGILRPGRSVTFSIFYGAAGSTVDALAALTAVGAEAYSLGKPSLVPLPAAAAGTPNTFIFGFRGIGGVPATSVTTVSPPTGIYTNQQKFDLVVVVKRAIKIRNARRVILNGRNITRFVNARAKVRKILGAPGYVLIVPGFSSLIRRAGVFNLRVQLNLVRTRIKPTASVRYNVIAHRP